LIHNKKEVKTLNIKALFYDYKLNISHKYVELIIVFAGMFNLFLLIPDLTLVDSNIKRLSILIARGIFSLAVFIIFIYKDHVNTFKQFSTLVTIGEFTHVAIFLFVLSQYKKPDFLIQTLGMIVILIAVFSIPNKWANMLSVAIIGSIGFFICTSVFIDKIEQTYFWSAIVYIPVVIIICAITAWNNEKHQFNEFIAKDELQRISSTDYLTNAVNRYKMKEEADKWIDFCHRHSLPLSLIFIDVDNLKKINDKLGHLAGDIVLVEISNLIQGHLKESDILARWGGDEFILLLPDISLKDAIKITEEIKNTLCNKTFMHEINVTCSYGVATLKEETDFESLLEEADNFMYKGKKLGKNNIQWC